MRIAIALLLLSATAHADEPDPAPPPIVPAAEAAAPPSPLPAENEYERRKVGFFRVATLRVHAGGESGELSMHWGAPYQGEAQRTLARAEFYDVVERPDHARFYRQRSRRRLAILLPSVGAMLLGAGLTIWGAVYGVAQPFCHAQDHRGVCLDTDTSPSAPLLGVGVPLFVFGTAGVIVGGVTKRVPTTRAEDHALARAYNQRLRQSLGLGPVPAKAEPEDERPVLLVEPPTPPRRLNPLE